ncbi:MAG: SLBB domain-containing protein [Proteiniphilum sp.]|nr:SLBB domain-containing protein [Proteiniphilum sp.]
MRKIVLSVFFLFMLGYATLSAQSMSDAQVYEYIKAAVRQGKEQNQIATELALRGVTQEQAMRVKDTYEERTSRVPTVATGSDDEPRLRDGMSIDDTNIPRSDPSVDNDPVFGRNIFNTRNLTFEPSANLATPPNYQLGPGDEIIIDIWGASQITIREIISPDGTVNIQNIGPIFLSGLTVTQAGDYIRKTLNKRYSGIDAADSDSDIRLTLGNTRTIQINVMGEVVQPGTYSLSSFSTVFHALYRAGGVNRIGSLRNVQLIRNGKKIATVDVYEFIMKGHVQDDIRIQEGDVVIVPVYEALVRISGRVKRAMRFEMKKDETLATLISYAGGFDADAYTQSVRIVRQNGMEYEVNTVKDAEYGDCGIRNGDDVEVGAVLNRFSNKLEIRGAVYRPGIYQLSENLNTVRALIDEAQGLTGDAFLNRAVLHREREDLTREILSIDVRSVMDGTASNIALQKNDSLYIPSIHDIEDRGNVTIHGEVARPGSYAYADNMTMEDLILLAGGLKEAASTIRVDVARRLKDPLSVTSSDTIGEMTSFSLKNGFMVDGKPEFTLQPYDEVYIRRSPGYSAQQNVYINGEVLFEGAYAMTNREERLSDLVRKAGGATEKAYLRGAKLTRVANAEEIKRMSDAIRLMRRQLGDKMIDSLGISINSTFTVGIDLEKALTKSGGSADLILREGDVISIPVTSNVVTIDGAVMMPNTVSFAEKKNINYYLNQAGGYSDNARRSKKFIVYMNGEVTRVRGDGRNQIEPGCEIIVPSRERTKVSLSEVLGFASTFSSLGLMAASVANLLSR